MDVPEPSWLPYATFGVSVLAAGGASWAAIITGKLSREEAKRGRQFTEAEARRDRAWTELLADRTRAEERADSQRTWERDRVTEHYLALLREAHALATTYARAVVPAYMSTPVGDLTAAWAALDDAFGRLVAQIEETHVVARPAVKALLPLLLDIDGAVMVPLAETNGVPSLASERAEEEVGVLAERTAALTFAMRCDLGLADDSERERLRTATTQARRRLERSLSHLDDAASLRSVLRRYNVVALPGAAAEYQIGDPELSHYLAPFTALRQPVAGLLYIGDALAAATAADLDAEAEVAVLKGLVRYVETGLRDGPGKRLTPDGRRIALWFR